MPGRRVIGWATIFAVNAFVVFGVGVIALVLVNRALAFGVWGETLGVPLFAALVAFALVQCFPCIAAWLRVARLPPWVMLLSALGLAYLGFVLVPLAAFHWGWWFLAPFLVLLLAAPVVSAIRWIGRRWFGRLRAATASSPGPVRVGLLVGVVAIALATVAAALELIRTTTSFESAQREETAPPAAEKPREKGLALAFRPLLYFDSKETFAPLDIEQLVEDRQIRQCRSEDDCERVRSLTSFKNTFTYLKLQEEVLPPGDERAKEDSSYYYRFSSEPDGRAFLDYWWYFSSNPSPVARSWLCGPGTRWFQKVCGDHPSDWEGVTIVLRECDAGPDCVDSEAGPSYSPDVVRYAQHDGTEEYDWLSLKDLWRQLAKANALAWGQERGTRPLVFVARRSHASYEKPCGDPAKPLPKRLFDRCPQAVRPALSERRDGLQRWVNNDCTDCLSPLPATETDEPAEWNWFRGRWGRRECILGGAFCSTGKAPEGPAQKKRYRQPGG